MNQIVENATELALIQIPDGDAVSVFTGEYDVTIAPLLTTIERAVAAFKASNPDPTTEEGRKVVGSFDHKLARSKTFLDNAGKKVNAALKELPKKIDANRRRAWDTIEAWQTEITAPVEAWKAKEKARIDGHIATIAELSAMGSPIDQAGRPKEAMELRLTIAELESWSLDTMEEFRDEAEMACGKSLSRLMEALAVRERYEADQVELAALRAAQAEQQAKEAAERAAREHKERAERENAERVAREHQSAIAAAAAAQARAEANAREATAKAERDALALKLAAEAAERQRLEAEARARREADAAAAREKEALDAAAARVKAAAEAAAADKEHRKRVNREAAEAIMRILGTDFEVTAREIVVAIARGEIPSVSIKY